MLLLHNFAHWVVKLKITNTRSLQPIIRQEKIFFLFIFLVVLRWLLWCCKGSIVSPLVLCRYRCWCLLQSLWIRLENEGGKAEELTKKVTTNKGKFPATLFSDEPTKQKDYRFWESSLHSIDADAVTAYSKIENINTTMLKHRSFEEPSPSCMS